MPAIGKVVIQNNVFNRSRINTVTVCALTSNIKRAKAPGNVLLELEEANLSKQSVVVVSQILTVDKSQLGEYIGSLTRRRITTKCTVTALRQGARRAL
ncbi:MAG: type II toxin-antitoxin system PemK/MazF family toxin [Chloroflexota bacterium]